MIKADMFFQEVKAFREGGFLLKGGGLCSGLLLSSAAGGSQAAEKIPATPNANTFVGETHSDVGSLFPMIQSEAVKSKFPLSFSDSKFKKLRPWKKSARQKVLELLHYSPEHCDPRAEVVERVDKGDYIREKIYFNTTPSIRVPAYLLLPKNARKRSPAIVALHDHGGFYLWGKEKLVETEDEPAVLKNWRKT